MKKKLLFLVGIISCLNSIPNLTAMVVDVTDKAKLKAYIEGNIIPDKKPKLAKIAAIGAINQRISQLTDDQKHEFNASMKEIFNQTNILQQIEKVGKTKDDYPEIKDILSGAGAATKPPVTQPPAPKPEQPPAPKKPHIPQPGTDGGIQRNLKALKQNLTQLKDKLGTLSGKLANLRDRLQDGGAGAPPPPPPPPFPGTGPNVPPPPPPPGPVGPKGPALKPAEIKDVVTQLFGDPQNLAAIDKIKLEKVIKDTQFKKEFTKLVHSDKVKLRQALVDARKIAEKDLPIEDEPQNYLANDVKEFIDFFLAQKAKLPEEQISKEEKEAIAELGSFSNFSTLVQVYFNKILISKSEQIKYLILLNLLDFNPARAEIKPKYAENSIQTDTTSALTNLLSAIKENPKNWEPHLKNIISFSKNKTIVYKPPQGAYINVDFNDKTKPIAFKTGLEKLSDSIQSFTHIFGFYSPMDIIKYNKAWMPDFFYNQLRSNFISLLNEYKLILDAKNMEVFWALAHSFFDVKESEIPAELKAKFDETKPQKGQKVTGEKAKGTTEKTGAAADQVVELVKTVMDKDTEQQFQTLSSKMKGISTKLVASAGMAITDSSLNYYCLATIILMQKYSDNVSGPVLGILNKNKDKAEKFGPVGKSLLKEFAATDIRFEGDKIQVQRSGKYSDITKEELDKAYDNFKGKISE